MSYNTHRNTTAQNMGYTTHGHRITPAPGTFRRTGRGQLDRPAKPASEKQLDLLDKIYAELQELGLVEGQDTDDSRRLGIYAVALAPEHRDSLTLNAASGLIEAGFEMTRRLRRAAYRAQVVPVTDGIYYFNDEVVKVQRAVHGSGQLYAKRLVVADGSGVWEYAPGLVRQLRPEHKMTREQAAEFGHLYGVCCVCGATLTNENSIEAGIGPVCSSRLN